MDFVLWKPSDENTPRWGSPWGYGRPGWHIECSAMAKQLLGDHFDIHGGGNDLMFPHHENEIAQSCCANHGRDFANIWMHNEMLQVEGKKMSKSLGNFFTVRDLLNQGIPGEVIRFVMLSTHYTKPMDWTKDKAKQAENTLHHWHKVTLGLDPTPENEFQPDEKLIAALSDDLNTHLALTYLRALQAQPQKLLDHARFMGFLGDDARTEFAEIEQRFSVGSANSVQLANLAQRLDGIWKDAKQRKDFTKVDAMKANLVAAGVQVKMSNTGVELTPGPDFDAQKLETL
jgi:cysteinyl-tRNA synthetase